MREVSAVLVHHPVLDRSGSLVTSAITNIDLHDISRSCHSFGLANFFVVHPIAAQRELAERIREHWVSGSGGMRIPDRKPALSGLRIVPTLDDALTQAGTGAELWTTSAQPVGDAPISLSAARQQLAHEGPPVVLCFGTGWGLAPSVHARTQVHLEPIRSPRADGYNHLSVRAAVAILLDRLMGVDR